MTIDIDSNKMIENNKRGEVICQVDRMVDQEEVIAVEEVAEVVVVEAISVVVLVEVATI